MGVHPLPHDTDQRAAGDVASPTVSTQLLNWFPTRIRGMESMRHATAGYQSMAESFEDFPDASFADRNPPVIPNHARQLSADFFDSLKQVCVYGELLMLPSLIGVHMWRAGNKKADIYSGRHGSVSALQLSGNGSYAWVATMTGALYEVDTKTLKRINLRKDVHTTAVTNIFRLASRMLTLDIFGNGAVWAPDQLANDLVSLRSHSYPFSIPTGPLWVDMVDQRLWTFYKSPTRHGPGKLLIYTFDFSNTIPHQRLSTISLDTEGVGVVTSAAVVPSQPHMVYVGHESGHLTTIDTTSFQVVSIRRVSTERITALCGPSRFLWVGFDTGHINVLDVGLQPWRVMKRWKAHQDAVEQLFLDVSSVWEDSALRVVSSGKDCLICFWDGFCADDWIESTLRLREPLFSQSRDLRVSLFSYNVDGVDPSTLRLGTGANQTLLSDFLLSVEAPDIVHFGFQEMIDLSNKSLGFRRSPSVSERRVALMCSLPGTVLFATEGHDVTGRYSEWRSLLHKTVMATLGPDYVLVQHEHLVGLASDLFARNNVATRIKDLAVTTVKTGFGTKYGNKGSILIRFVLEDSSLCFINNHLAAGLKRPTDRSRDIIEIIETKSRFPLPPTQTRRAYLSRGDGTRVSDHELVFFAGDLNYRIDLPRQTVLTAVASNWLEPLLAADQLKAEMEGSSSFRLRSFVEPPIQFAPTYKYDHNSDRYDTSKKKRVPAWCDRILFRSEPPTKILPLTYLRYEADISDHRPISGSFLVKVKTVDERLHERVYRRVLRDWEREKEALLETVQSGNSVEV